MYCLHCGDCCKRFSPFDNPNPCRYIKQCENFYFCGIYNKRPRECRKHEYQTRFCPIGLQVLGLDREKNTDKIRERIDSGNQLITSSWFLAESK